MSILSALTFDSKRVTTEGLRRFNLLTAAIYLIEAAAIAFIASGNQLYRSVNANILTQDDFASASQSHTVLASATRHLFDLNLGYVAAVSLLLGSIIYALLATALRRRFEVEVKAAASSLRWRLLMLNLGTLTLAVGLLSGVADLALLVILFLSAALVNLGAAVYETTSATAYKKLWQAPAGLVSLALPTAVLLIYLITSFIYGNVDGIQTVLAALIYVALLIYLIRSALRSPNTAVDFPRRERNYAVVVLLAQSLICWLIISRALA